MVAGFVYTEMDVPNILNNQIVTLEIKQGENHEVSLNPRRT